jgi:hypothetical protein
MSTEDYIIVVTGNETLASPAIALSRDEFKEAVFNRDSHRCVNCHAPAQDAHHIIDRALWGTSQGYYLNNGVSLCSPCHLLAEQTLLSCSQLRALAGMKYVIYPDHFFSDERYDKWGNIILPSGMRIKGEMFGDENVQKILPPEVLLNFLPYTKYPRTYHTPWSENLQNDDRMHDDVDFFIGKEVVVSEKIDGECSSCYSDYIHARSIDSKNHESRTWVKALHGQIAHEIPKGWRICGENMYAKHSIHYHNLESYFYVYSIWDENNIALSWDDTVAYSGILGLKTVPVFFRGVWGETTREDITKAYEDYCKASPDPVEGYVIRVTGKVAYKDYRRSYAKMVRKGHVQTSRFWMKEVVIPNEIKKSI